MRAELSRFAILALCGLAGVANATPANDYAVSYALTGTPPGQSVYAVTITPDIYARLNPSAHLADLVVVNALGREVPFGPMPDLPPVEHPFTLKARLLPLPGQPRSGEQTAITRDNEGGLHVSIGNGDFGSAPANHWIVDARQKASLTSLEIDAVPGSDMQFDVAVDASDDLQHWDERVASASIVSIARGDDAVDSRSVSMDGLPARYYRIRLVNGSTPWPLGKEPSVTLAGSAADTPPDRIEAMTWLPLTATVDDKNHTYDFRLPGTMPVGAVQVLLADANTAARFTVSTDDGDGHWVPVGTIDSVRTGHMAAPKPGGADTMRFADTRTAAIRLTASGSLGQPPGIKVGYTPDHFVFLAEGSAPFKLLAGSYAARRADAPLDAVLEKLRGEQAPDWTPAAATIGPVMDAAGLTAMHAPAVPFDWTRPLLWGVLVLAALLVAGMAFSLLRQSKGDNAGS